MTPYALLLVRPTDTDLAVRQRFHALVAAEHPDRNNGVPGTMWYQLKAAYEAVKTAPLRAEWVRLRGQLAGTCVACRGYGVTWRRVGQAARQGAVVCAACEGEGRQR